MRILLTGPVPPELGSNNPGGVARHVWDLAKALHAQGHEVELLAMGRYFRPTRKVGGIQIHGLDPWLPYHVLGAIVPLYRFILQSDDIWTWRDYLHFIYGFCRLRTVFDESYDIIHAHGYSQKIPVACSNLGVKTPVVLTVHSYSAIQFASTKQQQKVMQCSLINKGVDALIHVSYADQKKGRDFGVNWNCIDAVVHNAVNVEQTKPSGEKREGVCFVGTVSHRKGIDVLIEAWRHCSGIGPLCVVGDGPELKLVNDLSEQFSCVETTGYLKREKALQQMRGAQVLVVPSKSESFGLIYLEALLMGTPVIGYHRTLKEFISVLSLTEEELGYIYPFNASRESAPQLAKVIKKAVEVRKNDADGRIAKSIAKKVRRHFSWDRIVPELESVYNQVA